MSVLNDRYIRLQKDKKRIGEYLVAFALADTQVKANKIQTDKRWMSVKFSREYTWFYKGKNTRALIAKLYDSLCIFDNFKYHLIVDPKSRLKVRLYEKKKYVKFFQYILQKIKGEKKCKQR